MKKIIFILIIINSVFTIYSLNKYETELVGMIKTGSHEYEIGYDARGLPGDGPLTAKLFTISHDNKIYIFDKKSGTIKIFTDNLEFIKSIPVYKQNIYSIYHLKITEENEFLIYDGRYLKKLNKEEELVYKISHYNLPQSVKGTGDFHPYKNWVFFYDRVHGLNYIDETGKIHKEEETKKFLEKIKTDSLDKSKKDKFSTLLNDFKDKDKLLIIEGKLLSTQGHFLVKKVFKYLREKNSIDKDNAEYKEVPQNIDYVYIGRDNDNNTYWESNDNNNIYIFSEFGELLDFFEELNKNQKAVSPDGDLWYWDVQPEGVTFYKITRRW